MILKAKNRKNRDFLTRYVVNDSSDNQNVAATKAPMDAIGQSF